tara:strand:- start:65 stop:337 length:273 start_codon:yes stop_codon:yes gene_type:complete
MSKRPREDNFFRASKRMHIEPLLTKRKQPFGTVSSSKKQRVHDSEDLRRRNFELEQTVTALINKVKTLEYMLQVVQERDTIQQNKYIEAY